MAITIPGFTPSSPFTDAFLQYVRDEQEARRQREIEKANEPGMGGLIGQIAGTAIGFVAGGPPGAVIGGSIGGGIGGAVDPRATSTQRLQAGAQAATSLFSAAFSAQDVTEINRQEAQDRFGPGTSLDQLISGADRFGASGGGDFTSEFARQILGTGDEPRQRRYESRRIRDRREEETFRQQGRFELEDIRAAGRASATALKRRLAVQREARSELSAAFKGTGYTVDGGLTAFQQLREQDPNLSFSSFLGQAKLDESSRIAAAGLDITLRKDQALDQQNAEQQQAAEEDQKIGAITEDASAFVITPEQVEKFGVLSRNIEAVRENRIDLDRSYLPVLRKAKQDLRDFVRPFQKRKPPPTLEQLLKTPGGMSQYTDDGFILNQTKDGITVTRPPVGFMGNSEDGFQTFTVRDEDTGAITGVVVTGPDRKTHSFPVQPDPELETTMRFVEGFVKSFAAGGDLKADAIAGAASAALEVRSRIKRQILEDRRGETAPPPPAPPAIAQDPVTVEQIAALMESQALPSQWPAGALAQGQEMIETQARQIAGTRNENGVFPDEETKDQFRYLVRLLREIDIRKQGAER